MSAPNPALLEWVRSAVVDLTEAGHISRLELWHAIDGEGGEILATFRMEDREEDEDVDDLTQEIWDTAEHDATTRPIGTNQRYVLQAYRLIEDRQPETTHPFLINGRAIAHLIGGDTEPPTEKGIIAQTLRHSNELHRMLVTLTDSSAIRIARELDAEHKRRVTAEQYALSLADKARDLEDRRHERELELMEKRAAQERSDRLNQMLLGMLPLVMAKLMSGMMPVASLPSARSARDESVGRFLEGLNEEQVMGFMQTLGPEQQLQMMELYKSYKDDLEQKAKGGDRVADAAREGMTH